MRPALAPLFSIEGSSGRHDQALEIGIVAEQVEGVGGWPPQRPEHWRQVGWARRVGSSGHPHRLYEALTEITCHTCQRTIRPGQRFSRPSVSPASPYQVSVCARCLPFIEV